MRLDPAGDPTPDEVAVIDRTRAELDTQASRQNRDPRRLARAYSAYDRACRDAGVLPPPPLDQLQPPERPVKSPSER